MLTQPGLLPLRRWLTAALLLSSSLLWAQTPTGSVSGTVQDTTGAVVPNAVITLTNQATGLTRNLVTGSDGTYNIPALAPGVYQVKTSMKGFRSVVRDATVETGAITTVNVRLEVGQTEEVVTVEAASAQIEYTSSTIAGVITREKIQDLPLNGRSFLNLAMLEPGVTVSQI